MANVLESPKVAEYLDHLNGIEVIPPKDGKKYSALQKHYTISRSGEDKVIRLNERQVNVANIMANDRKIDPIDVYVMAGYTWQSVTTTVKTTHSPHVALMRIKSWMKVKIVNILTPGVMGLINYIKADAAASLGVDATWLLNEQINLYEECRREGDYTAAIRLLHDISFHVDVDSRVNNKIEIVDTVDYAALLQAANSRTALPLITDDVIEGELVKSTSSEDTVEPVAST